MSYKYAGIVEKMMTIRLAQNADLDSILKVVETAFSDEENKVIKNLVLELSTETASPSIKSLIAEVDNQVIGYVSYSPISLKSDSSISGYILAPLAVSPEHQKQGIGSNLINAGMDMLTKDGVGVFLVYGDPAYYGRFGFTEEIGHSFVPPHTLQYPFGWTGMMLNDTPVPEQPIQFECVSALSKPDLW
ncbi:N-acetyltransferase [Alphaproteobacteria bacterium]|nr:N-acetyltransferase [Alphaproteobacteria bacterium]